MHSTTLSQSRWMMRGSALDAAVVSTWDCTDRKVVHQLYERLGRAIATRISRIVKRADVGQEILQETFVKLWHLGPTFASERAAFAWVYKTSHNLALDHLRSSFTRSDFRSAAELDEEETGVLSPGQAAENRDLLRRAVAKLTSEEMSVLIYKVIDQMTLDEIATFVGGSSRSVSRTMIRIEGKLERAKVMMHDKLDR